MLSDRRGIFLAHGRFAVHVAAPEPVSWPAATAGENDVMKSRRTLISLAASLVALHLTLTIWVLFQPAAAPLVGRLQTPAMMLFSLGHAGYLLGWRRALLFFALSAVISWLFEQVGVATGLIYGRYHYSDLLGARLGHVPVAIPISWFMMMYPSYLIANLIGNGRVTGRQGSLGRMAWLSFLGAMVMTAWDLAVDPILSGRGFWIWEDGGPYFGVPLHNFAGWLATTFTVFLAYRLWERRIGIRPLGPVTPLITWLPLLAYASHMLRTFSQPEMGLIAFFAMGFPLLAAANGLLSAPSRPPCS